MNFKSQAFLVVSLFLITWIGTWVVIAFPLVRKFQWQPFTLTPSDQKLQLLLPLYLLAPLIVGGANYILGQSWSQIGVRLNLAEVQSLLMGIGIAIAGMLLLLLLKQLLQIVSFPKQDSPATEPFPFLRKMLIAIGLLALGIWIGGIEELVFRGWIQTQLEIAFSPWIAATLGSFVFALAHLIWDGRAGLWQQPGLFLLGWVLVIARWVDGGSLALAWGLHAGWVWGLAIISELLKPQTSTQKPVWLAGRPDQPLTSGLDLALIGGTAWLIWLTLRQAV